MYKIELEEITAKSYTTYKRAFSFYFKSTKNEAPSLEIPYETVFLEDGVEVKTEFDSLIKCGMDETDLIPLVNPIDGSSLNQTIDHNFVVTVLYSIFKHELEKKLNPVEPEEEE